MTFLDFAGSAGLAVGILIFQKLNLGNETADLILTRGGLGLGAVALWGAHARQMSETAMSIPLFLFVFFGQLPGFFVKPRPSPERRLAFLEAAMHTRTKMLPAFQ